MALRTVDSESLRSLEMVGQVQVVEGSLITYGKLVRYSRQDRFALPLVLAALFRDKRDDLAMDKLVTVSVNSP